MNSITGPSLGLFRTASFASGGIALASACRTIRRCTPSFFATARIEPAPCVCSRLISSNSSTLRLLSIAPPSWLAEIGQADLSVRVGPNVMIEVGPLQSSEIMRPADSSARNLTQKTSGTQVPRLIEVDAVIGRLATRRVASDEHSGTQEVVSDWIDIEGRGITFTTTTASGVQN